MQDGLAAELAATAAMVAEEEARTLEALEAAARRRRRVIVSAQADGLSEALADETDRLRAEAAIEGVYVAEARTRNRHLRAHARRIARNNERQRGKIALLIHHIHSELRRIDQTDDNQEDMQIDDDDLGGDEEPPAEEEETSDDDEQGSVALHRLWPSGGFDAAAVFDALRDEDVVPFLAASTKRLFDANQMNSPPRTQGSTF